jgi:murein DD-endopeptidase MepM/ murein hydrolase activator NlpD
VRRAALAAAAAAALLVAPAASAATLAVAPPWARPGDVVLVSVSGADAPPRGTIAGRPLLFWKAGDAWRALAALPLETPLGAAAIAVDAGGPLAGSVEVRDAGFRTTTLSVAPRFVEPPKKARARIAADRKAFQAAYAQPFAPPLFSAPFEWPRRAEFTGRFGDQRTFNGVSASVHYGLDLQGPVGAPVLAANDGVVVLARDCYMSGRSVVVWHGAGVYSVYFHLSKIGVAPGRKMRRGDPVGLLGATGRATGPHLHWSVKVDGLYVDPESLLRVDAIAGTATPPPAPAATPAAAPAPALAPAP